MGWVQIAMPDMPFNQTFSFPHELTLRTVEEGVRMFAKPVDEIQKIHRNKHTVPTQEIGPNSQVSVPVSGQLFDVRATFEIGDASQVGLDIGGNRVVYDAVRRQLGEAPLKPVDGRITVQVLVDRPMMEICGNDGRVFITLPRQKHGEVKIIKAFAAGGVAKLVSMEAFELSSIWKQEPPRSESQ